MAIEWVTAFVDLPAANFAAGRDFWLAVTGYELSAPRGETGQFATFLPPKGDPYLRLQRIDTEQSACHIDLHTGDVRDLSAQATSLGATVIGDHGSYAVLASPVGMTFCIVGHHGETERPAPKQWPEGQRSLMDQVCFDVPPDGYDEEVRFWGSFTGWDLTATSEGYFERLVSPPAMPLRFLLQRLDDDDPSDRHAHLDLACDDVAAEQLRHEELGARTVRVGDGWITLQAPGGDVYCITGRDPSTGTQRSFDPATGPQ